MLTIKNIQSAQAVLQDVIIKTPGTLSRTLSELAGAEIYLKFENLQFTSSFKDCGALIKLLSLNNSQRRKGVIAMSAGNHAQAVAYHAQRLGIPAVIVMPQHTTGNKVEHTDAFGAGTIAEGIAVRQIIAALIGAGFATTHM